MSYGGIGKKLNDSEIVTIIALYILGGKGYTDSIAEKAKMDVQYVRNILRKLEMKGVVRALRKTPGSELFAVAASVSSGEVKGRRVIWMLSKDFMETVEEYKEDFERYAKKIGMSLDELIKKIEGMRSEMSRE